MVIFPSFYPLPQTQHQINGHIFIDFRFPNYICFETSNIYFPTPHGQTDRKKYSLLCHPLQHRVLQAFGWCFMKIILYLFWALFLEMLKFDNLYLSLKMKLRDFKEDFHFRFWIPRIPPANYITGHTFPSAAQKVSNFEFKRKVAGETLNYKLPLKFWLGGFSFLKCLYTGRFNKNGTICKSA